MPTSSPPDLPALPGLPHQLADYLRKMRAWAHDQLDTKVAKNEAVPAILFSASDQVNPTAVFSVTVDHLGVLHIVQVPLGKGNP